MIVKTHYNAQTDLQAWSIWEGNQVIYVCKPDEQCVLAENAKKAGYAWILDANKLMGAV